MGYQFWEKFALFAIIVGIFLMWNREPNTQESVAYDPDYFTQDQIDYRRMLDENDAMKDFIDNARSDPTTGDYFIGESYHGTEIMCVNMGGANGYVCQ